MKLNRIEFYIGGCRSGKSRSALQRAEALDVERRVFVATCRPTDYEMQARVARHRRERGERWETIEEPLAIGGIIRRQGGPRTVILVDCLTLWLTNMVLAEVDDTAIEHQVNGLAAALDEAHGPVLLVANEVGMGIVPGDALSRRFRDWAGTLNQKIAGCAGSVFLIVAGLPFPLKIPQEREPGRQP